MSSKQRTYSHLAKLERRPSSYEIVSSDLLYYVGKGFEVNVPTAAWYEEHQRASRFSCSDWERFRDPRETTYASYTDLQRTKEAFVDGLLRQAEESKDDERLSAGWLATIERVLPPLRYPVHGLQMVAAYAGQMAPSGRIVIASLFQAGDEMRRVQRFAYRMRQLEGRSPRFGEDARARWQSDPLWQPTREMIEKLLVTYDWGESFVALSLVFKPRFDELVTTAFAALAEREGDALSAKILHSLREDCRWHLEWSRALVAVVLADRPENREAILAFVAKWAPLAQRAIRPFAEIVGEAAIAAVESAGAAHLAAAGLAPARTP